MTHYVPSDKERAINLILNGVMYCQDGRELCVSPESYSGYTQIMCARQEWKCAICDRIMGLPTFDHEAGRGFSGSHRNDDLEHLDGRWRNAALCLDCNSKKGSRRYEWRNREYVPIGGAQ